MTIQKNEKKPITQQMSQAAIKLAEKNRSAINSLMECMKLSVVQGFAMRGHRDNGVPTLDDEVSTTVNLGNFKSIVQFRALSGDAILKDYLEAGSSNYSKYVSNTAQSDMLACILKTIQQKIVDEARSQVGEFVFAVSADEVTDVSCTEQLALVIRTVSKGGMVRELLLQYVDMDSIKGEEVSKAVIKCLGDHGIDIKDCRAQTYDGAANMSGRLNGCQAHISRLQPLAQFLHCGSHRLNLALNSTSKIQEFRIMMENVKQLGIFYKYSSKRTHHLSAELSQADPPIAVQKVIQTI